MLFQPSELESSSPLPPCADVRLYPAFEDNYLFLIKDKNSNEAAVVDPGDALPLLSVLKSEKLDLRFIFITHHHRDHIGGLKLLLECYPNAQVVCGTYEAQRKRIPHITKVMCEGEKTLLWDFAVKLIEVPGHTLGHVAYYFENKSVQDGTSAGCLFIGDTLFGAGAGGLFEGSFEQMLGSLEKIRALPDSTLAYCAHEYTEKNLWVALQIKEENPQQEERFIEVAACRAANKFTVPLCLGVEKETNPFLRWDRPSLQKALQTVNSLDTFTAVRKFRDKY